MTARPRALAGLVSALVVVAGGTVGAAGPGCVAGASETFGNVQDLGVQAVPRAEGRRDGILLSEPPTALTGAWAVYLDSAGVPRWRIDAEAGKNWLVNDAAAESDGVSGAAVLTLSPEPARGCEQLRMRAVRAIDGKVVLDRAVMGTRASEAGVRNNLVAAPIRQRGPGGTGIVVEQRTFSEYQGVTALDKQGRELTPAIPVAGLVVLLDGRGGTLGQWRQPALKGPGPMAVGYDAGGGSAVAVLRTSAERGPDAAVASVVGIARSGRQLWQTKIDTLHDSWGVTATRRGPVFMTENLQLVDVNGSKVPTGQKTSARISALDGRTGRLLWSKDVSAQAQVYASGGDVIVDAQDAGTTTRLGADDGRIVWQVRLPRPPFPLVATSFLAGDLTGEGAESLVISETSCLVLWLSGRTGDRFCHPELAAYWRRTFATADLNGDGSDDLLGFVGEQQGVGTAEGGSTLLSAINGRDGKILWSTPYVSSDSAIFFGSPRLSGRLPDVVAYTANTRVMMAFNGRTGESLWTRSDFTAPAAR